MNEEDREETHAQPAYRYGDPLEVLIREESETCRGCVHEATILGRLACDKGKRHGDRCKLYVERLGLGR
jgi:inorganic pyrophosphatase